MSRVDHYTVEWEKNGPHHLDYALSELKQAQFIRANNHGFLWAVYDNGTKVRINKDPGRKSRE